MSGAIDGGYIWNPMTAGEVFVRVAKMMMNGEEVKDGMTIDGMGQVKVDAQTRTILGNQVESEDKENIKKLVQMGL
jgi:simple sugar transport system substrate-binding protein